MIYMVVHVSVQSNETEAIFEKRKSGIPAGGNVDERQLLFGVIAVTIGINIRATHCESTKLGVGNLVQTSLQRSKTKRATKDSERTE
jgi:hypothetical protein